MGYRNDTRHLQPELSIINSNNNGADRTHDISHFHMCHCLDITVIVYMHHTSIFSKDYIWSSNRGISHVLYNRKDKYAIYQCIIVFVINVLKSPKRNSADKLYQQPVGMLLRLARPIFGTQSNNNFCVYRYQGLF